jgi:hypothetical protein
MVGYKGSQPMNTAWLIARRWDRLGIGNSSPVSLFRELQILYWAHRAVNPRETDAEENKRKEDEGDSFRSISDLMSSIRGRIEFLRSIDSKMKMTDDSLALADSSIEIQINDMGAELWEITVRCKLIDNVRAFEGELAL